MKEAFSDFARITAALIPALLALYIFEVIRIRSMHPLPSGSAIPIAHGLADSVTFVFVFAAVWAGPAVALLYWSPRIGRLFYRAVVGVAILASAALSSYFTTALVPLGDDLFGYSIAETIEAARSSGGFGPVPLLLLGVSLIPAWLLTGWTLRIRESVIANRKILAGALAAAGLAVFFRPPGEAFASEEHYYLARNKGYFFSEESFEYLRFRPSSDYKFFDYPLLNAAAKEDVLSPFLNKAASRPNIVIVMVEGLGREFMGAGAKFGGFTPFLDSLSTRSLYWENFLANQGRTFGVFPSLLGSLPPARGGFLSLKKVPPHATLVSLLADAGYETSFFTGTNGHFDMIDSFLDRHGIDRIVDQSAFPRQYQTGYTNSGGFSWGYPDHALFTRSLEVVGQATPKPRLDLYLTISSHEPFRPPGIESLRERFDRRLNSIPSTAEQRAIYTSYRDVFSTLLYVDDAIRTFMDAYSRRPDFERTIFVITGDHRLIPVPEESRISRFHVPLIIYSALLKQPQRFESVSSHLDVTPSLIELLRNQYGMTFPDTVAWLGSGLDTARGFRSVKSIPLMRTKAAVKDFLSGTSLISRGASYRLSRGMTLALDTSTANRAVLESQADSAVALYSYTVRERKILPQTREAAADSARRATDEAAFNRLGLDKLTSEQLFAHASRAGFSRKFDRARVIARHVLAYDPRYHDMRVLLGRTYAWERRFDESRPILEALARRAPSYREGRLAVIDLEIWSGNGAAALARTDSALRDFPGDTAFLNRRPRALGLLAEKK